MLIPALIDLIYMHENYKVFILSSLITAMTGLILVLSVWGKNQLLGLREAFILISLTWLLIAIFSAIPHISQTLDLILRMHFLSQCPE